LQPLAITFFAIRTESVALAEQVLETIAKGIMKYSANSN
jgi:hypothetical protein